MEALRLIGNYGMLLTVALLTGCSGYDGSIAGDPVAQPPAADAPIERADPDAKAPTLEEFFDARVAKNLNFCRNCHVPGGVADKPDGDGFLLSLGNAKALDDLQRVKQAWQTVGSHAGTSRMLTMASGQERHAGGAPWPTHSRAHHNMSIVLECFADAAGCEQRIADEVGDGASDPSEKPIGDGGGNGGDGSDGGGTEGEGGSDGGIDVEEDVAAALTEHFTNFVQPSLEFCRNCHVPAGVADVPDGDDFTLTANPVLDLAQLQSSWKRLGGGVDSSRILTMASGAEKHSGGSPWPASSAPHNNMRIVLACFDDPDGCRDRLGLAEPVEPLPLLGSSRARHLWVDYCASAVADAVLPADPRSLVVPGANASKAVFFNAWYQNCHINLPVEQQQPRTCGEFLERVERGRDFMLDELAVGNTTASSHNNSWQKWGLDERPEDFDRLYTLRYGLNPAPFHNPYPVPGEDPATTDGGSGQLPQGLRQRKDADGNWTGRIGTTACYMCHGGAIGDAYQGENLLSLRHLGLGNSNYDVLMAARDGSPFQQAGLGGVLPAVDLNSLFNVGIKQRGQNNAVGAFEFLVTVLDFHSLGVNANPLKTMVSETGVQDTAHPLAHTQDTPQWWNYSHRARKFFDAGVSVDSLRILLAAGFGEAQSLFTFNGDPYRNRIEQYDQDVAAFLLTMESPPYPEPIDEALARQGAVLFHAKDLWAEPGNEGAPRPLGGNGSCASCHGAYSPRYVHDPDYLQDPVLEGIAAHIAPLEVIQTDRARSDMLTPTLRKRWEGTFWGYPEGQRGHVPLEDKDPFTEAADDMNPDLGEGACGWQGAKPDEVVGYQAPPLYGVWASAPYFHNGAVPTLEQVLDSSQRPLIWRRKLETRAGITGFDQSWATGFDKQRVGWKHDELSCADMPGNLIFNCNPADENAPSLVQSVQSFLNGSNSWTGVVPVSDPDDPEGEKRLIFDTRTLGNSADGHRFSDVLSEQERRAIIEYLKTL